MYSPERQGSSVDARFRIAAYYEAIPLVSPDY